MLKLSLRFKIILALLTCIWSGVRTFNGIGALPYLMVFGSTSYAVYSGLPHTVTPVLLGTYPRQSCSVSGIGIGLGVLGETLSAGLAMGILIIFGGVLLVSTAKHAAQRK
ncbi:MAG: hypothetical protein ABIQ54_02925 [Gammaproteobacteria bacterium]